MSKTKTLKKSLSFLLALSMLFCFMGAMGSVSASAATDRVSMYSADCYFSRYGVSRRDVYIQTKDNASNQQVYVHYNFVNGQDWQDEQATYFTTLPDGSKIWKASISSYNTEYAIKYVADGQIIWDNNNGNNYTYESIGTAPITVNRTNYYPINDFLVRATLQNYAYEKNVVVRYTNDNWATYQDVPLKYMYQNTDGTETWEVFLPFNFDQYKEFEYCVYYQVNGQTYWANNFGQNYDASYRMQ